VSEPASSAVLLLHDASVRAVATAKAHPRKVLVIGRN
jgi:hypothetical protein